MSNLERLKDKGFINLPEIANIKKRPDDPYSDNTEGVMHVQKFIHLFEYLTEGSDWNTVLGKFDGHILQPHLKNFSENDIADFCRHLLIANKNKIGWQVVDELLDILDKKGFVPGWELPDSELYNKLLGETYTTIINLKLEETIGRIFNQIITGFEELDIYHVDLKSKINSKFQIWNYKDLLDLYELLHDPTVVIWFEKRDIPVQLLVNRISRLFIATVENPMTTIYQKVGLAVLFLKEYVKDGKTALIKSQELIELVSKEIDKLSIQERISFRTLLGSTYSYLMHQIFITGSDFLTRRRLLGKIISNFIISRDLNISNWFLSLTTANLRPEALIYILKGYYAFVSSLNMHIVELPDGEIKNELRTLSKRIVRDIKKTLFSYMEKHFRLPKLETADHAMYYYQFNKLDINKILKKDFLSLIHNIVEVQLSLGSYLVWNEPYRHELDLIRAIYESERRERELIIFNLSSQILLNEYPYAEIYDKILEEFMETDTIILSPTFENEIIVVLSQVLDYLLKTEDMNNDYRRFVHEILIAYIGEWLNVFSQQVDLFNDAFMLLTPIVSINFIQIIREYFIKNNIHKAFLTYLNMYYFSEYCVYEIKKSEIWKLSDTSNQQKAKISNKFNSMIKDWKIEELLDIDDIKRSVTSIEMTMTSAAGDTSQTLSGMIEDEIVLGYLDKIQKMESFISLSSENSEGERDLVEDLNIIYEPPVFNPLDVFCMIGITNTQNNRKELPFPLIRQVHEYTIAMDFFPIDTTFIDIIGNKNLFESIMEVMDFDK